MKNVLLLILLLVLNLFFLLILAILYTAIYDNSRLFLLCLVFGSIINVFLLPINFVKIRWSRSKYYLFLIELVATTIFYGASVDALFVLILLSVNFVLMSFLTRPKRSGKDYDLLDN